MNRISPGLTQAHRPDRERLDAGVGRVGVGDVVQFQAVQCLVVGLGRFQQQVRLGRGEPLGQLGDAAEGDLCLADDRQVVIRCSSGPFMYSSTRTKPLITDLSLAGHSDCRAKARPMTTKNSIEPRLLAITKVLIERTWVSRMPSAVRGCRG
jgi:hypothetical protein